MLVVGLYDGNIAVYNLQKNTGLPSYQSDAKNGKHRDIVWQVMVNKLYLKCSVQFPLQSKYYVEFSIIQGEVGPR